MSNLQAKEFFGIGGWPLCAVCNKPVEKMEVFNDLHAYARTYRASCHGAKQDVVITDIAMMNAIKIVFDVAFVQPKLEKA